MGLKATPLRDPPRSGRDARWKLDVIVPEQVEDGWAGRVGYGGESGGVKRETIPARACLCQSTCTHHRFGGTFQYLLTQISEARRMEMFNGMEWYTIKLVGTRMVDNQSTPAHRPHILHSRVD